MIGELDRRLANIVRVGTVTAFRAGAVDGSQIPMVQVDLGDLTTDWLPVAMSRAGGNGSYDTPEAGEQVLLFAPSGELANAYVMGSIPQTSKPAKFTDQDKTGYSWADGAFQTYDRAGHHYALDIPSAGDFTLHVGAATLVLKNGEITATIGSTTLKLEDGKSTLTTNELNVNSALSKFSGNVQVAGGVTVGGGLEVTETSTLSGAVSSSSSITGGSVHAGSIDLAAHHHTAQGSTAPTTAAQA